MDEERIEKEDIERMLKSAPGNGRPETAGHKPWTAGAVEEWCRLNNRMREIEEEDRQLRTLAAEMLGVYGYMPDQADDMSGGMPWRDRHARGTEISFSGGILTVRVPEILPHRRSRPDTVFYSDFKGTLEAFCEERPVEMAEIRRETKNGAVLVVRHSYRTRCMVRDGDNTETKPLIDALDSLGFIKSDCGGYLDILLTARIAPVEEGGFSELFLMSKKRFKEIASEPGR